ncbi:MAG: 2-hydroxyacyl-CoA dehydratase family protein [Candidatus Helarchaeota archaeon]
MEIKSINDVIEVLKQFKEDGSKIIGVIQHGIFPDELIYASGAHPLKIILGGKEEQEIGDQYLSATTCPFSRSTLRFLETSHPLYSLIDTMIEGTFCNGVANIANYLDYFNIPSIPIFIPHGTKLSAFKYYLNELEKIKDYLEQLTGNKITSKKLIEAIKIYNEMRALLRKINNYRQQQEPPISGKIIHQLVAQANLMGPKIMIPKLRNFLKELEENPPHYSGVRIFLTGSGITLGDNLFDIIEEEYGGLVVADDLWSSTDFFLEDVDMNDSNPIKAIAIKYFCKNLCGRMIPDPRIPKILELYNTFGAQGIINHTLKYCDSYSNLKYEFRKIMLKNNIQVLDLDRDYADSDMGQLRTRIEAFLEMIV